MIEYQTGQLSEKNKNVIESILDSLTDDFSDFYITRENLRLFIRDNKDIFWNCLKKGDGVAWDNERGLIFITGYSDKSPRKYVKILAKDEEKAEQLLKVTYWHVKSDLFAKVKKENPIRRTLQKCGFRFAGSRGKEILLKRNYIPYKEIKQNKEVEEE